MSRTIAVVYRLFDASGQLLYVGVTENVRQRWIAHGAKPWWPLVARHLLAPYESRDEALAEELRAIRAERPLHNQAGSPEHTHGRSTWQPSDRGHLVGAFEIGKMLDISRQRVQQLVRRPGWPSPWVELTMGKVWRREDVEEWIAEHRPDAPE